MTLPPSAILNPYTTLYTPIDPDETQLIILCTWLGAGKRTIPKYIALHQQITPRTPVLLIESSVWTVTPHYSTQRARTRPAVTVLQRTLSSAASQNVSPKILVHTSSNGGSNSATQLLLEFQSTTGKPLPIQGIVCDSAPAAGGYWKSYHSVMTSLPKNSLVASIAGPVLAHAVPGWMYLNAALGRYPIFEDLIRDTLLSSEYVTTRKSSADTGDGKKLKIAYIWSKKDELIEWRDIVEHAAQAERLEWEVRSEEFLESAHCNHLKVDGERYLKIVKDAWEREV
ncbi:hypothetical protein K491DRAFT_698665 [Lophiostoma macrostomum CBS 122681]|uniref:Indole-diterpene biosynthesis protein-like protein PaxU n=1 Tax=Lophiostoma macrostomum CBS 122681 TaxID=1314788 RepID=A0A6A6SP57_9PLEO|nr:hypothetical protein K491DRAFT_698665 [Lophiostoma macrostomum CBS 122681]